jgi:hypothetical protein
MRLHIRYGIILAGIIVFLVISPLIVFYLMGVRYDFSQQRFEKTGIVSGKTNPRGAELYIDGKLRDTTPTTLRFLKSGDYDVEIRKQGYFSWKKRLNVKGQYVTWLNPGKPALFLFRSAPQRTTLAQNVSNLIAGTSKFVYATGSDLYFGDIDDPQNTKTLPLPQNFNSIAIQQAPHSEKLYIISAEHYYGIYDSSGNILTDISKQIIDRQHPTGGRLQLTDGGKLYELRDNSLFEIDWKKQQRSLVVPNILSFYASDNAIYYIDIPAVGAKASLNRIEMPTLAKQVLREDLPSFRQMELYLTSQNQVFILADGTLYALNEDLKRIADSITSVKVDLVGRKIVYASNNEISIYDIDSFAAYSVTRSSTPIKNPVVLPGIGWSFYLNDGRLQTIEMDDRDHQNNYTFANVSDNSKFFIDSEARDILLLDQGKLERLQIRQPTSILLPTD